MDVQQFPLGEGAAPAQAGVQHSEQQTPAKNNTHKNFLVYMDGPGIRNEPQGTLCTTTCSQFPKIG